MIIHTEEEMVTTEIGSNNSIYISECHVTPPVNLYLLGTDAFLRLSN